MFDYDTCSQHRKQQKHRRIEHLLTPNNFPLTMRSYSEHIYLDSSSWNGKCFSRSELEGLIPVTAFTARPPHRRHQRLKAVPCTMPDVGDEPPLVIKAIAKLYNFSVVCCNRATQKFYFNTKAFNADYLVTGTDRAAHHKVWVFNW